jgi:hypothetical protein
VSKKTAARWQKNHPEEWKAYSLEYRIKNKAKAIAYGLEYRRQAKLDAIRHYSNGSMVCHCCGESEVDFLNIDHIHGGGTKERKVHKRGGSSFAVYLRTRGFPSGFRILCYNCNCALAHFSVCPHERKRNVALVQ